jgi:hypothetical protein
MPDVHVLPTSRAAASAAATNPRNAGTCGIYDIAGRLGMAHHNPDRICRTLNLYVDKSGFPAPYPTERAGDLITDVRSCSRWATVAVDAWFDDQLPPAARGRVDAAERAGLDSRLSARAASLFVDDAA